MTKNETELIIRQLQVTNNYVGALPVVKRAWYRRWIMSAALAAAFSVAAWAQTQLATVFGTIADSSGAVIPNASVTIISQGIGLKRSALTDTAGEYRFAGLPTGNYSLRIEKTGFQSQVREGFEVTPAAEVMINSQLAIGALSQQTTLSGNIAAIDNTTSTINELVPEQSLTEQPLDNRVLYSAFATKLCRTSKSDGPRLPLRSALKVWKFTVGAEAYNPFNHPNFGVPSNTQSASSFGGNGDAVFKDAAGD